MTASEHPVTGGCQCGSVRYALHAPPVNSHVCHCRMCQRASGNLFAALVGCPKDKVAWTRGVPSLFRSSSLGTRGFCSACGTPLSFAYDAPTALFYVTTGSLDRPEQVPIIMQYGIESRIPWVDFCEDVPGEATAQDPEDAKVLAAMQSFQSREG